MPVRVTPLVAPDLYPADPRAILQAAYNSIYAASGGTINDFSANSTISTLLEGQMLPILELLFYTNQLPDAAGLSFLKVAGIQRILGKAAQVTLTFTLSSVLPNNFTLGAGYVVKDSAGHEFATDSLLVITAGQSNGQVTATASAIINGVRSPALGRSYNVAPYQITKLTETRAFLKSVTNETAAAGGLDEETLDEARSRGFATLRRRDVLVSADDYEQVAREVLGAGSVAITIGLLDADRQSQRDGAVHTFVLNPDRSTPNLAQLYALQSELSRRSPAGLQTLVFCSALELFNLEIHAVATLIPGSNPQFVSQRIQANLDRHFTPGDLPIGKPVLIKEVEKVVRDSGVANVQSVSFLLPTGTGDVKVSYGDLALANDWTAAILYSLEVELVDSTTKQSFPYSYGSGGDKD